MGVGRKNWNAAAGVAVCALIASSLAASAQTLTDTMVAAYKHSGLLQQNQALLRAADEDVAQSLAALRPVLTYVASANWADQQNMSGNNVTGSAALQASLILFDFGRSQLATDAAKETVLSTRETLLDIEQSVLLRAVSAYFNVRRNEALVELQTNNVSLLSEELRATRDRFEVGEVTRTDVSIAEAREASARAGRASAIGNLATAREEYRAATGAYPTRLAAPPAPPAIVGSQDEARSIALQKHPALRAAQRDVKVAELNLARSEKSLLPTLNGSASFTVDQDLDDSQSLGLSLTGPIYQGGQLASVTRQSRALVEASRASLHVTRHSIEQEVGNAWASLTVARSSVMASDENVRASRVALRGAQEERSVGARTTLDVLDLDQDLLQAETDRISAIIDRDLATYQLLDSMGLLTIKHLGLGIPTYDPAAYYNAVKGAPTFNVSPQGERLDRVLKALGKN